jgi:putative addiction module killer protein
MFEVRRTDEFRAFLADLRDFMARAKIIRRIERLEKGNPGDVKPVGQGISEMRIDHGPGYRVYFKQHGATLVVLLCGGDKSTQETDIRRAKQIEEHYQWP